MVPPDDGIVDWVATRARLCLLEQDARFDESARWPD